MEEGLGLADSFQGRISSSLNIPIFAISRTAL